VARETERTKGGERMTKRRSAEESGRERKRRRRRAGQRESERERERKKGFLRRPYGQINTKADKSVHCLSFPLFET